MFSNFFFSAVFFFKDYCLSQTVNLKTVAQYVLKLFFFLKILGTECLCNNPCLNNGVCVDISTHLVKCTCPSGFTGNFCEGQ